MRKARILLRDSSILAFLYDSLASVNRGNNGFEGDAGDLCRRYPSRFPARKASSSALPKAPALPQNSKGPPRHRRGRFARPQGEGWLPPAEAENAANVALRLPGGAVSPCLPMLEAWRPRGKTHQCAYIVELQAAKGGETGSFALLRTDILMFPFDCFPALPARFPPARES